MKHTTLFVLLALMAVVAVATGGCSKAQAPAPDQPVTENPAPEAVAPESETPAAPEASPAVETPAAEPVGANLTAETLTGTAWQAGPLKLEFGAEGALTVNGTTSGSWKIDVQQLTVQGPDIEYKAQIKGDQIFYGEMPLVKIQ